MSAPQRQCHSHRMGDGQGGFAGARVAALVNLGPAGGHPDP